ncbi:MAG: hypothetical protein L6R39_003627 [Caloplaca ligustica]|nr:MAG: hypothetical protein L6R39_003627 [Caloplaca ligustica]
MFSATQHGTQEAKITSGAQGSTLPAPEVNQSSSLLPSVNKPKSGGAMRSIDEKLGVSAVTGTASTSITIPTSAARAGFGPQLSLNYDSGAGNGIFGFGWSLGLAEIVRKTDQGLPRYQDNEDSDVFILNGSEDLVPSREYNSQGHWSKLVHVRDEAGRRYRVTSYRPRVESAFSNIERWTDESTQLTHWRTISGSNVTTLYGYDEESRVFDPKHPARAFKWLISRTFDDRGNAMLFQYKRENADNVPQNDINEANMEPSVRTTQVYPKSIKYGNATSFLLHPDMVSMDWLFEVVFDYGEHHEKHPSSKEMRAWETRPDPFSTRRAGFEIRTYRLCKRILMIHHFPDEPNVGHDCVVSSLDIVYHSIPSMANISPKETLLLASCISCMSHRDYVRHETGYRSRALPPTEFDYTSATRAHQVCDLDAHSLEYLVGGVDGTRSYFLDLDGEGIPGVVTRHNTSLYYSANRGNGQFDPPKLLLFEPSSYDALSSSYQWMDLAGDGHVDLVQLAGPMPGFSKHDGRDRFDWSSFQSFESFPNIDTTNPNMRLLDLTGDGHMDILLTDDQLVTWYESWAEKGFGRANTAFAPLDEDSGPRILFSDSLEMIYLADMTGDGLSDIVRIRNHEICYWPNLGWGQFGRKVTMRNAPLFDVSDRFKQERLHLADIDGTGTSDILYVGSEGATFYLNQSGNSWTSGIKISAFPQTEDTANVQVVDLFGRGTSCLVWSSNLPSHAQKQIRYVDLVGPVKPYLISATRNNLGLETRVNYATSTKFYLNDKQSGQPWATRIPFPVQVVESVESEDRISGNRYISRYAYHHGYYDGIEREFRGFGMVEQWDTEDLSTLGNPEKPPRGTNYDQISDLPPVLTKTWFHTGAFLEGAELQKRYESEYWQEPGSGKREGWRALSKGNQSPQSVRIGQKEMPYAMSTSEAREACRAMRGSIIHSEIYAQDGTPEESRPYRVSHSSYAVVLLQPRQYDKHAVFLTHERESITSDYERQLYNVKGRMKADPRINHSMTLSTDEFGNVLEAVTIAYGRRYACVDPFTNEDDRKKQSRLYLLFTSSQFTNHVLLQDARRLPMPSRTKQFELINITSDHGKPTSTSQILDIHQVREAVATVASGNRDLPYEDYEGKSAAQDGTYRRLISHSLALYRKNSLDGVLQPGELESLAIPSDAFTLAFSQAQMRRVFVDSGKLSQPQLDKALEHEGGYQRIHDQWWKPSGRTYFSTDPRHSASEELQYARQHFFVPRRAEDPFGTSSLIEYDKYDLLVKETRDIYNNRRTVGQRADSSKGIVAESGFDYRLLLPHMIQDPNGNRMMSSFDIHGMVVGSATMGKPQERLGDNLDGFVPDLTETQVQDLFSNPKASAKALLGSASERFIYDNFAYYRSRNSDHPKPTVVCSLNRETHVEQLAQGQESRILISLAYYDGLNRTIQEKMPAEAGPVTNLAALRRARKKDHSCQYAGDDQCICWDRWITSGWTAYNNKGMKVRIYEPFFSRTHDYESDNKLGVSPITFFDPLGRAVGVLSPDHTWSKSVFEPWRGEVWDKNDTVLMEKPGEDVNVGGYFKRLPEGDYLPTWHQQNSSNSASTQQKLAAIKTAVHANTPSYSFVDSLGRPILTTTHKTQISSETNKLESEYFYARKVLDIEGKEHEIWDTKGRLTNIMVYSLSGEVLYNNNMDSGERWSLPDINGMPIMRWDNREQQFRTTYDKLRRVTNVYLNSDAGRDLVVTRTVYGESSIEPEHGNWRGKVIELCDQSGLSITDQYDFKGNLVASKRKMAKEFRQTLSVSGDIEFEPETYISHVTYDALNRQTSMTLPNGAETRYVFNVRGQIQQVWSKLNRTSTEKAFVKDIEYDAKGKQTRVDYGNGTTTKATYDLYTFRLVNTRTTVARKRGSMGRCGRSSSPSTSRKTLLNMSYTYDAMGNITNCCDRAQETLYFRGKVVHPDQHFTYDSLYRLIEAGGREHLGQRSGGSPWSGNDVSGEACQTRLDHPHDGNAMTRYIERYVYDSAGNIQKMQHESESWHSWTRRYCYNERNPLDPNQVNNRLSETQVGSSIATYSYEGLAGKHGNMTSLPSIPKLTWNFHDQLQSTCRRSSETEGPHEITWFVYDVTGKRVRKITEQPGTEDSPPQRRKETLYIGSAYEIFRTYSGPRDNRSVALEIETLSISSGGTRLATVENRLQGREDMTIPAQLIRYQYSNYQNSVVLELDDDASIISYEEYTPYGSTSYQAMHTQTEVPKRYRWTGKEKDTETGLYHNGLRYYMAGIARWTSADPQGLVDGLNLYAYAKANPIAFNDPSGTNSEPPKPRGPPPQINWQWGDLNGYGRQNPTSVKAVLGNEVGQSHIVSVDALKWLTNGVYKRENSAGNPFEFNGQLQQSARDPILYYPQAAEELISKHMEPVMKDLKGGKIPDIEAFVARTKAAFSAGIGQYNESKQEKLAFNEGNFDKGAAQVIAKMRTIGIPTEGFDKIAQSKAGPPSPPPAPPSLPPPSLPSTPTSGGGAGTGSLSSAAKPILASALEEGAHIGGAVASKTQQSRLGSLGGAVTSAAKATASSLLPFYAEFENFLGAGGLTYTVTALGSTSLATLQATAAIEAAPLASECDGRSRPRKDDE